MEAAKIYRSNKYREWTKCTEGVAGEEVQSVLVVLSEWQRK